MPTGSVVNERRGSEFADGESSRGDLGRGAAAGSLSLVQERLLSRKEPVCRYTNERRDRDGYK